MYIFVPVTQVFLTPFGMPKRQIFFIFFVKNLLFVKTLKVNLQATQWLET